MPLHAVRDCDEQLGTEEEVNLSVTDAWCKGCSQNSCKGSLYPSTWVEHDASHTVCTQGLKEGGGVGGWEGPCIMVGGVGSASG